MPKVVPALLVSESAVPKQQSAPKSFLANKEPEEIGHAKPVSLANGTVSKVIAQNTGEAVLLYHQNRLCSPTNVPWSRIYPSLTGSIQGSTDFRGGVNVSFSHSPPNLDGLDKYQTTPHDGKQIRVRYRRQFCSRYSTLTSNSKTDPTKIYLDTCASFCLGIPKLRRPSVIIGFTKPRKRIKMDPTPNRVDKKLPTGSLM
ncbi:hypothetical protein ACTXT7_006802 [Hymenolepis weldensis]